MSKTFLTSDEQGMELPASAQNGGGMKPWNLNEEHLGYVMVYLQVSNYLSFKTYDYRFTLSQTSIISRFVV
jgi:hypothetical protein